MKKIFFLLKKHKFQIYLLLLFPLCSLILSHSALGETFNLQATWTENEEIDMAGYNLYRTDGTRTKINIALIPHPPLLPYLFSVTVPDGSSGTLTFVVTAVDTSDLESVDSSPAEYSYGTTVVFSDDFSTDKGWTGYESGSWERGPAFAGGGENGNPDPASDHSPSSDNNILGFAIAGDYTNNLVEKYIVSPPINCTGQSQVFLKFWRYLNVESNYYDHAKVYVSNDGTNWAQLWENPGFNLMDNQWIQVVYDISSVAANQATVYIKFTMGPSNASGRYSGWNIDDLEVTSNYVGPLALYVPSGDSPNPNIDEIMIENGLGIKHSNEIPADLNNYNVLIVSKNEACNSTTANYIKNFIQNGDGAIIMGGTPKLLAGNTDDLSTIVDWFGAGGYGNDCGYGAIIVNNPLGTDLLINDMLDYAPTNTCVAASVYNLNTDSTWISRWRGWRTHSFIHSFGQGRVFYYAGNPGFSGDPDPEILENGHTLFEAGLLWASNCVFSDIPSGYWAYDYIISIYNAGLTTGCTQDDPETPENERRYCPEDYVTREQMAAFIVRAVEGEPPLNYCDSGSLFPDVTPDMWSCRYIKRLKELEITTGYSDGLYWPYDQVLREQMAAFLVRAVEGEPPLNYCDSGSLFTDVTPDMWSCRYIKRLKELAITTGYGDGSYGPYDFVTRDQMAAFLSRAFFGMQ